MVAATPARAQRLNGTLTDSATNEEISGAVVSLTDSTGRNYVRAISDSSGAFVVTRFAGPAMLRVVRIGYRPRELAISRGAPDRADIRMQRIPLTLGTVTASANRVCRADNASDGALALWEQARAGLLAGVVAREGHAPRVRLRAFEQTRDPVTRRVTQFSSSIKDVVVDRSYVAARGPLAFAVEGYMREGVGESREYFAPDDEVLLDPSFAETHCLRVVPGDAAHEAEIGIGFEPIDDASRDTLVDVSGVLWMDRAIPALRSLEFLYTNLEVEAKGSGGEVDFAIMPNGVAFIERWTIRSPILRNDEYVPLNGVRRNLPPRPQRTEIRVLGYNEIGGAVLFAEWPDGTRWHADLPRATGTVVDATGTGVAGARVWLQGTSDTVSTNVAGEFALPYAWPGLYVIFASDSALARQGIARTTPRGLSLFVQGDGKVQLYLHPRSEALRLVCPTKSYRPGTGVLMARVVDSGGDAVAGAHVDVELEQAIVAGDTVTRRIIRSGEASDDGRFVVCGAALDQPLRLRATKAGSVAEAAIDAWKDDVLTVTLVVKPK